MASIVEDLDKYNLIDPADLETKYLETYAYGADLQFSNGKGIPLGASIGIFGESGNGKTTILLDLLKKTIEKQRDLGNPFKCIYVDVEDSYAIFEKMGLLKYFYSPKTNPDGNIFYYCGANSLEHLSGTLDKALNVHKGIDERFKDVKLIFIDSITMVRCKKFVEDDAHKANFGDDAKFRGEMYNKFKPLTRRRNVSIFYTIQVRTNQGAGMFEAKTRRAGSEQDMHNLDILAKFGRSDNSKDKNLKKIESTTSTGDKEKVQTNFKTIITTNGGKQVKNRFTKVPPSGVYVRYGKGCIDAVTLASILEFNKLLSSGRDRCILSSELIEMLRIKDFVESNSPKETLRTYIDKFCYHVKESPQIGSNETRYDKFLDKFLSIYAKISEDPTKPITQKECNLLLNVNERFLKDKLVELGLFNLVPEETVVDDGFYI